MVFDVLWNLCPCLISVINVTLKTVRRGNSSLILFSAGLT
jgi:hypothetical protein